MSIDFHPASEILPVMSVVEFNNLKADIKEKGLLEPIVIYENKIVDGRHRYKACTELNIQPNFIEWENIKNGEDYIAAYVISKNLERRHLTSEQKAIAGMRLKPLLVEEAKERQRQAAYATHEKRKAAVSEDVLTQNFGEVKTKHDGEVSQIAAKASNTNREYIRQVETIEKENTKLIDLMHENKLKLAQAKEIVKLPKDLVEDIITYIEEDEEIDEYEIKQIISKTKKDIRFNKIAEISQHNQELPTKQYNIIYCDPPWFYENSNITGAAANHYPLMREQELIDLDVKSIFAKDSILFMWATAPQLDVACRVMQAWGLKYTTCAIWNKNEIGSGSFRGYYFRIYHELLLIGKKGNFPPPDSKNIQPSVFNIKKSNKHSEKPKEFYEIIESMYPQSNLSKIELFARNKREGWDSWGNQTIIDSDE